MKAWSGHIILDKSLQYKDLVPVYESLYEKFLNETGQKHQEEPEYDKMLLRTNMMDLERNRKPEGYNRLGKMRMVFPRKEAGPVEFYLYRQGRSTEVTKVTENLSDFLRAKGIKHTVEWDSMLLLKARKRRK